MCTKYEDGRLKNGGENAPSDDLFDLSDLNTQGDHLKINIVL